jgi:hypothetical protein
LNAWFQCIFLAFSQVTTAAEAGPSAELPLIEPVPSDVPSLRSRVAFLEERIRDLQRSLAEQGAVARRASADEDFMLAQITKASEHLACKFFVLGCFPFNAILANSNPL